MYIDFSNPSKMQLTESHKTAVSAVYFKEHIKELTYQSGTALDFAYDLSQQNTRNPCPL